MVVIDTATKKLHCFSKYGRTLKIVSHHIYRNYMLLCHTSQQAESGMSYQDLRNFFRTADVCIAISIR
jgi:hypothetical protein